MSNTLQDRVVVITGAGSGMGESMAQEFVAAGARVAALDINDTKAKGVVAALGVPDSQAVAVGVDIASEDSVNAAVDKVLQWAGQIDVLCNNAGIIDSFRPAHQIPLEEWNRNIAVNLTGPFLMARAVIPDMLSRSRGVIINTASIASFSAAGGGTAYTAAKHGVLGMTRQLSFDYGKLGIRVNAICPGATMTGLTAPEGDASHLPDSEPEILRTPAQRWGLPVDIARLALYLAGDDADFIHGAAMVIDGGWLTAARNPI
ncbi:SDR family oxidoreductase [Mycolicibacterium sp. P9-64]|uniref:SDR family NAD(P)-dependent oxidoreductase n=1 Tax=Mycolicibacterium sp. P9-64 TaxID=2024612 RepID=UPI0011EEDC6E|nr:glucose 1-dehydrogenase [Mycolicibacterium sp. P9-64]KAA0084541.1 SDR family oxidoreductase [Mycolicibacterium sp. P9-64]